MSSEKILVIQTAFLGDAVLTLPMIQYLSKEFNCTIDVLCNPSTTEVFASSPFVNKVIAINKKTEHKSFMSVFKFAKMISRENYTKIYSPHRSFRTSLIVLFSSVEETFGFSNASIKQVYKNIIEYRYDFHEVRRNLDLAGYKAANDNWKIFPILNFSLQIVRRVDELISEYKLADFAVIAPGSIWNTKQYPEKYFKQIINYLIGLNLDVVLIGGESDLQLCSSIEKECTQTINLAGKLSIVESIQILKRAKLLICNDSAPTHFAMCADIPTLTIYCSTVPEFGFYPYNEKSKHIGIDNLNCKPCGVHGHSECPLHNFNCGEKLVPQLIFPTIEKLLNNES